MIEYTLQETATDSNGSIIIIDGVPQFYFQPLNLGKTRISGFEVSATGDVKVRQSPYAAWWGTRTTMLEICPMTLLKIAFMST